MSNRSHAVVFGVRLALDACVVVSLFLFPWWMVFALLTTLLFLMNEYYEGVFLSALGAVLYVDSAYEHRFMLLVVPLAAMGVLLLARYSKKHVLRGSGKL